jgi:glycosyltransferase involved in cell wall biosynthesis
VDGYRQRTDHVLRGLARAGEVELVALDRPEMARPGECPIEGVEATAVPASSRPASARLVEWPRSGLPRRVLDLDWTAARQVLATRPRPDLLWVSLMDPWPAVRDLFPGVPTVVDFDNLENFALQLRRRQPPRVPDGAGLAERAAILGRWLASRALDLPDERRWDRLQRDCGAAVDRVVVCSALDAGRSGCPNAVVVANGAEAPAEPRTDRTRLMGDTPTMLFVGALDYEPNARAVEWFVDEVLPGLRSRCPDAVLRVVGRGADRVAWAAGVQGVELVGPVPEMGPELERADVSVVPLRVGAGTRLKVVEAMAHRIPVVTTTVGCEGIDVVDRTHALVADDPVRFAESCANALADGALRQRLADAAAELFEARYTWGAIEERVADLAREVAGR